MRWHRGQLFHVSGSPPLSRAAEHLVHVPDGGLLVDDDGLITWSGAWRERPDAEAPVSDHPGAYLLPGFVDTHLHFPQVHCVDAYGGGNLLDWLDRVVFPSEARLADPRVSRQAASDFCDRLIGAGTTTSMVFGSQFASAQEALVAEVQHRGLRVITGRTIMTVGPESASALVTDDATAVALCREEIERWLPSVNAGSPLTGVALVPRFALSVEPSTLRALGELYSEYRAEGLYVTTHLNENRHEVQEVQRTFGVRHYLDVYDGLFHPGSQAGGPSLLGRHTILAHAVHAVDDELMRIVDAEASVAHCPVSQGFLGSGTLPWRRTQDAGVRVAMGSDIAAGDSWFMPRVLNACFKAHMNGPHEHVALDPAELLHLGTLAGAQALDLDDRIGNLDVGKQADFVVLDPTRSPALDAVLSTRAPREDPREDTQALLFALLMAADEGAVAETYVSGRRLLLAGSHD